MTIKSIYNKAIYLVFLTFIVVLQTQAQLSYKSNAQSLDKNWEYLQGTQGDIIEVWREAQYQVRAWQKVDLPHSFNALDGVDPDHIYYQGEGWYRKNLVVKNPYVNGRTLLHFEGAGQKTKVFIGNKPVGSHVGGYDEFTVDITDAIHDFEKQTFFKNKKAGEYPLTIACDNSRDQQMIPSNLSDFSLYGGLYRHLNLVYVPEVAVKELQVTPSLSTQMTKGTIKIKANLLEHFRPNQSATVNISIKDAKGKEVMSKAINMSQLTTELDLGELEIDKPALWHPNSPNLYTLELSLSSQGGNMEVSEKFGFRTFEFKEKGPFFLNGERLLLQGTHRHEDHAGTAAAMSDAQMTAEMILIKKMGANFIRLGHYQQSRKILELCDSLGLVVWEEIPWCRGGVGNEVYQEQGFRMMRNMISQHRNHPSVILWGLGNENDWEGDFEVYSKDSVRAYMTKLNDLAHSLDPSRVTSIRRCGFCSDIPDVYSPSIWAGWYRGVYTEYKQVSEDEMKKVKHFLHVEWGGDNHVGRYSENPLGSIKGLKKGGGADERAGDYLNTGGSVRVSKDGDWSESYFADLVDWHLKEQETMPWLTGTAQWVFKDFSTPLRPENPIPYVNQKGIVERDLTPKDGYYVFQSYWAKEPMVHIFGQKWDVRNGKKGEKKLIKVFSNCPEVELFVNGKSKGVKKRDAQDYPAAGLRWDVVLNEGQNTLIAKGISGNTIIEDKKLLEYSTKTWEKPTTLKISIASKKGSEVLLMAKAYDKNGVQSLDANQAVEFGLAGDGSLVINQGTSTGSKKIQLANGRAYIKMNTQGGTSIVSVTSAGMKTGFVEVK